MGASDKLLGLKENVIIGKLIPAGTGINRYRNIEVQPTEEARAAAYAIPSYGEGYYSPDVFGTGTGRQILVIFSVVDECGVRPIAAWERE